MATASEIIDALGGTSAVSTALKLSHPSVVHGWRRFNSIPEWRQAALMALAVEKKVPLAATDFPAPDERIPRRAA